MFFLLQDPGQEKIRIWDKHPGSYFSLVTIYRVKNT